MRLSLCSQTYYREHLGRLLGKSIRPSAGWKWQCFSLLLPYRHSHLHSISPMEAASTGNPAKFLGKATQAGKVSPT